MQVFFSVVDFDNLFTNSCFKKFELCIYVRINLPLFSIVLPLNTIKILFDGRTVKNKGKLILIEIFPSVQKHDI